MLTVMIVTNMQLTDTHRHTCSLLSLPSYQAPGSWAPRLYYRYPRISHAYKWIWRSLYPWVQFYSRSMQGPFQFFGAWHLSHTTCLGFNWVGLGWALGFGDFRVWDQGLDNSAIHRYHQQQQNLRGGSSYPKTTKAKPDPVLWFPGGDADCGSNAHGKIYLFSRPGRN